MKQKKSRKPGSCARWRPKMHDWYWTVKVEPGRIEVAQYRWYDWRSQRYDYKVGNVFRTKAIAVYAMRQIRGIFKLTHIK